MSREDGERWIVDLVRDARLDAKIDFKSNTVQMNHAETPVYQTVIDKTRGLLFRAQATTAALDAKANGGAGPEARRGGQKQQQQQYRSPEQ